MKRETKDADELDGLTGFHHLFRWRPGERKALKQRVNRRERRAVRQDTSSGRPS